MLLKTIFLLLLMSFLIRDPLINTANPSISDYIPIQPDITKSIRLGSESTAFDPTTLDEPDENLDITNPDAQENGEYILVEDPITWFGPDGGTTDPIGFHIDKFGDYFDHENVLKNEDNVDLRFSKPLITQYMDFVLYYDDPGEIKGLYAIQILSQFKVTLDSGSNNLEHIQLRLLFDDHQGIWKNFDDSSLNVWYDTNMNFKATENIKGIEFRLTFESIGGSATLHIDYIEIQYHYYTYALEFSYNLTYSTNFADPIVSSQLYIIMHYVVAGIRFKLDGQYYEQISGDGSYTLTIFNSMPKSISFTYEIATYSREISEMRIKVNQVVFEIEEESKPQFIDWEPRGHPLFSNATPEFRCLVNDSFLDTVIFQFQDEEFPMNIDSELYFNIYTSYWCTKWISLESGEYSGTIRATDLCGNINSVPIFFTKDCTPPNITIHSPGYSSSYYSAPEFTISVEDEFLNESTICLSVLGEDFAFRKDVDTQYVLDSDCDSWTAWYNHWESDLSGDIYYSVITFDQLANYRNVIGLVNKDDSGPEIFVPSQNIFNSTPSFSIIGEDPHLKSIYFITPNLWNCSMVNSSNVFEMNSSSPSWNDWNRDFTNYYENGGINLFIHAEDDFGQKSSYIWTIIKDTHHPFMNAPICENLYNSNPPTISLTGIFDNIEVRSISYVYNETVQRTIEVDGIGSKFDLIIRQEDWDVLPEGNVSFRIRLSDGVNLFEEPIEIVKDTIAPVFSFDFLEDSFYELTPNYTLYTSEPDALGWVSYNENRRFYFECSNGSLPQDFWNTIPYGFVEFSVGVIDQAQNTIPQLVQITKLNSTPIFTAHLPEGNITYYEEFQVEITIQGEFDSIWFTIGGSEEIYYFEANTTIPKNMWKNLPHNAYSNITIHIRSPYGPIANQTLQGIQGNLPSYGSIQSTKFNWYLLSIIDRIITCSIICKTL